MGNPFITYSNRPSVGELAPVYSRHWVEKNGLQTLNKSMDKIVTLATNTEKLSTIRKSLRKEMQHPYYGS